MWRHVEACWEAGGAVVRSELELGKGPLKGTGRFRRHGAASEGYHFYAYPEDSGSSGFDRSFLAIKHSHFACRTCPHIFAVCIYCGFFSSGTTNMTEQEAEVKVKAPPAGAPAPPPLAAAVPKLLGRTSATVQEVTPTTVSQENTATVPEVQDQGNNTGEPSEESPKEGHRSGKSSISPSPTRDRDRENSRSRRRDQAPAKDEAKETAQPGQPLQTVEDLYEGERRIYAQKVDA